MHTLGKYGFFFAFLCTGKLVAGFGQETTQKPLVMDPAWQIELVASEPDIVTPICLRFDRRGRLLTIESHTHQRADSYEGPSHDRIRMMEDTNGDGRLDRFQTFYEAGKNTMGLLIDANDWVYVSSRAEIYRIRDTDNDGRADVREQLMTFETSAEYPHNGVGVMTFSPEGELVFGIGENFGATYRLVGADGSSQIGSGEGGNIFACSPDGKNLRRIATGFWNPFGLTYDSAGRLWTVDNDPDASPPCRLIQVIEGGDYGFQFRFGRSGTNPLQSWNGTLPGTLPHVSATGEAPCAVLPYGDLLLVTSWGDNRIEAHRIQAVADQWHGALETLVQGNTRFRPVDIAIAKDGSLFISDWVDRSYPVHGEGKIWRLSRKSDAVDNGMAMLDAGRAFPALQAWEQMGLDRQESGGPLRQLFANQPLSSNAIQRIIYVAEQQQVSLNIKSDFAQERLAAAIQRRWQFLCLEDQSKTDLEPLLQELLVDPDQLVIQYAVRWIASLSDIRWLPLLRARLGNPGLEAETVKLILAAISYLELGSSDPRAQRAAFHELLTQLIESVETESEIRAIAINSLGPDSSTPSSASLKSLVLAHKQGPIAMGIVRLIAEREDEGSEMLLRELAFHEELHPEIRADAIASARWVQADRAELERLRDDDDEAVSTESRRILAQLSGNIPETSLPPPTDTAAWLKRLAERGDARAGFRVFQRSACRQCHAYQGRGSRLGPDLTDIGKSMSTTRLIESILQPSKEVAPIYVPWKVLTVDGKLHVGLKAISGGSASETRYIGSDGAPFALPLAEIEKQVAGSESIMPSGLERSLSTDELRDLIAFLQGNSIPGP